MDAVASTSCHGRQCSRLLSITPQNDIVLTGRQRAGATVLTCDSCQRRRHVPSPTISDRAALARDPRRRHYGSVRGVGFGSQRADAEFNHMTSSSSPESPSEGFNVTSVRRWVAASAPSPTGTGRPSIDGHHTPSQPEPFQDSARPAQAQIHSLLTRKKLPVRASKSPEFAQRSSLFRVSAQLVRTPVSSAEFRRRARAW